MAVTPSAQSLDVDFRRSDQSQNQCIASLRVPYEFIFAGVVRYSSRPIEILLQGAERPRLLCSPTLYPTPQQSLPKMPEYRRSDPGLSVFGTPRRPGPANPHDQEPGDHLHWKWKLHHLMDHFSLSEGM